jgi:hypothetical protein
MFELGLPKILDNPATPVSEVHRRPGSSVYLRHRRHRQFPSTFILMVFGLITNLGCAANNNLASPPSTQAKASVFIDSMGNSIGIVYLCDKSGSMLTQFNNLKMRLKESVNELDVTAGQKFNIVSFADEGVDPLFRDGMRIASNENKKLAMDYIDNAVASGGTLPIPAIRFALSEKPDLLYVLSDGFDNGSGVEIVKAFEQENLNGKTHINAIYFPKDKNDDAQLAAIMKKIAADGHGEFKKYLNSEVKN